MDHISRVSVIIPTFNRSHYLHQAIESVLAQTFSDFEILVVDDGSTDDTGMIVAGINDPRIRYLYQQNTGRSVARNHGLVQARGDYIAFLDDDDLYLPGKLAIQTSYLDSHKEVGLVGGGANIIDADGLLLRIREGWKEQPRLSLPGCLYACPLLTCSVLFRRQWLDALDHWFDPAIDSAEDTDFWIRLLLAGCQMEWTPHIVSAYRWHPHNSQQDAQSYQDGFLMMLDKLYANSDLPQEVLYEQPALYSHYYVMGACHAYASKQIERGQTWLMRIPKNAPDAIQGDPPAIVTSIVDVAHSINETHPIFLINTVFDHLPPDMIKLRSYYGYALSSLYMRRVFKAHSAQERLSFKDWLLGVYHYPRWLANRGVWSILIRNLLVGSISLG